jgi:ribosomal protein S18 acetylase RimI-like enzyme
MTSEPRGDEIRLRPARPRDYLFARSLYLDGARRHLSKIGRWSRPRLALKFRNGYKQAQTQVVCFDGHDVGWIQIAEFVGRLHLRQLHLVASRRGLGIGSRLIKNLLERATALGKPVTLEVMYGNRAMSLYRRLGFRQTGQDADKIQMIWRPRRG